MSREQLEARAKELEEQFTKLQQQALMVRGAAAEVARQLEALTSVEDKPALSAMEPTPIKRES